LLFTLTAFALRLFRLDYQSLWSDELWSITFAAMSPEEIVRIGMTQEPHPPLYNLMLHFWDMATGNSVFAVRYFSLLFGVLCVPLTYVLGSRLCNPIAGLVAALLMTVSPFHIWHSQDARMYTLVVAMTLLASIAFLQAWSQSRRQDWGLYIAAIVLGSYIHRYVFFALAAHNLCFLVACCLKPLPRPEVRKGWLSAQVALLLLYLPWLYSLFSVFGGYGWLDLVTLPELLWRLLAAWSAGSTMEVPDKQATSLIFALLFAYGLLALVKAEPGNDKPYRLLFVLTGLVVPILGVYTLQEVFQKRSFHERYLIYLMPIFYAVIAAGLARAWFLRPLLSLILVISPLLTSGLSLYNHYFVPRYAKGDYQAIARYVQDHSRPGDAIILSGEAVNRIFNYYYHGDLPRMAILLGDPVAERLASFVPLYRRLWVMPYWHTDLDRDIETWLAEHTYLAWWRWFATARLLLYATDGPGPLQALGTQFGESLVLTAYSLWPKEVSAGDIATLTLYWRLQERVSENYKVSLRLSDTKGNLYWQTDANPRNGLYPMWQWLPGAIVEDRYGILVPPGTPPGLYMLRMRVYNATGDLKAIAADGTALGYEIPLATIRVQRGQPPLAGDIEPARRLLARLNEDIILLGVDMSKHLYKPGDTLAISIYWQATHQPATDHNVTLCLVDREGQPITKTTRSPLVSAEYPTSHWQAWEVVRAFWELTIPAWAPAGWYDLVLECTNSPIPLGTVQVMARGRNWVRPTVPHPLKVTIGGFAYLLGYDLPPGPFHSGDALEVTLYWEALGPSDKSYTVFVHLLNREGFLQSQQDSLPCQGECPTTGWVVGEYLRDTYRLPLPTNLPPGEYYLEVGMYDSATGQRLPVLNAEGKRQAEDRILFGSISLH